MSDKIIAIALNYIVGPVYLVLYGIWSLFKKLMTDTTKHMYGKILVPLLAFLIFAYILNIFQ